MPLTLDDQLTAITTHSTALADAATDLTTPVEHCPGWSVADLVWHVTEVHWFWRTIAAERLAAAPDDSRRPARASDDRLVEEFRAGAVALVDVLRDADQDASAWTWYPHRQDVGFITRHQVQEAAVHHWDAAHATGASWSMDSAAAADAVEEFLTTSLADADDVPRLGRSLAGPVTLAATDTGQSWTVSQADPTAALLWTPGSADPIVSGTAAELLLWLYERVDLPATDPNVVASFRGLTGTD